MLNVKDNVKMFALTKTPKALEETYAVLKIENLDSLKSKKVEIRLEAVVDDTYQIIEKKLTLAPLENIILQKKIGKGLVDVGVKTVFFQIEDKIE